PADERDFEERLVGDDAELHRHLGVEHRNVEGRDVIRRDDARALQPLRLFYGDRRERDREDAPRPKSRHRMLKASAAIEERARERDRTADAGPYENQRIQDQVGAQPAQQVSESVAVRSGYLDLFTANRIGDGF